MTDEPIVLKQYRLDEKLTHNANWRDYRAFDRIRGIPVWLRITEKPVTQGLLQSASEVIHPSLSRVLDFGTTSNQSTYITTEILQGATLQDSLKTNLKAERALTLFLDLLEGLQKLHEHGVTHGLITPASLWVENVNGEPRLRLDLRGLVSQPLLQCTQTQLFQARYLPPEFIRTGTLTPASDLYQFSLCLGESLTGSALAEGQHAIESLQAHLQGTLNIPHRLRRTPLGHALLKGLHATPEMRYASAQGYHDELSQVRRDLQNVTPPPILKEGTILDRTVCIGPKLGTGGFATVYQGIVLKTGKEVAIKVLHPTRDPEQEERFKERFLREASAAARIQHPDIVRIYKIGSQGSLCYMIQEHLQGLDLEQELVLHGAMEPSRAIPLVMRALEALGEAHNRGIVHKDLKPANLFLHHRGSEVGLKILDFGIAYMETNHLQRLTRSGKPACTPAYAAPEYLIDLQVSPAIDVYQMGLILVELLTGQQVVQEDGALACFTKHIQGDLSIPEAILESPLGPLLRCALALNPARRFRHGHAFAKALRNVYEKHYKGLQKSNSLHKGSAPTSHPTLAGPVPPLARNNNETLDELPRPPREATTCPDISPLSRPTRAPQDELVLLSERLPFQMPETLEALEQRIQQKRWKNDSREWHTLNGVLTKLIRSLEIQRSKEHEIQLKPQRTRPQRRRAATYDLKHSPELEMHMKASALRSVLQTRHGNQARPSSRSTR